MELRHAISKSNRSVTKLQKEFKDQNTYVASLEIELNRVKKKTFKDQKENIEELQVSIEELEQYSRKNSLEIHGIPEDIDVHSTEKIEISHRLYRKQGIKPIIVKFANHKDKTKLYKTSLSAQECSSLNYFPELLVLRTKEPTHLY